MNFRIRLAFVALLVSTASAQEFSERPLWLHLNGYTHHFAASDANDRLFGVGLTWQGVSRGRTATAFEADLFKDSDRKLSCYVGASWRYAFRPIAVGITGALMYHRNFTKHNDWGVLPVALPFCETRGRAMKLRLYYIPPIRDPDDHQLSVQLMLPLGGSRARER